MLRDQPSAYSRKVECLTFGVLGLYFLALVIHLIINPMNNDVAVNLQRSGMMLEGADLYGDMIDTNPPLVFYLGIPAAWLAQWFGWSGGGTYNVFVVYIISIFCVSLCLCWGLINNIFRSSGLLVRRSIFVALVFVCLDIDMFIFMEREHIMFILVMPYILAGIAYSLGLPVRTPRGLLIGVLAGIGMAFKPFFLLIWLGMEFYLFFIRRARSSWRRPENFAVVTTTLALALLLIIFEYDYFHCAKFVWETYRGYFETPITTMLISGRMRSWLLAALAVLLIKWPPEDAEILKMLFGAATLLLLVALIQRKGWSYHFYPCRALAYWIVFVVLVRIIESIPSFERRLRFGLVGFVLFFMTASSLSSFNHVYELHHYFTSGSEPIWTRLLKEHAAGNPIYVFSFDITLFPAVNYAGAKWLVRYVHLWPIASVYIDELKKGKHIIYNRPAEMGKIERSTFDAVVFDLLANPPKLLIFDHKRFSGGKFDFREYFSQDKRFAQLMLNYQHLTDIDSKSIFKHS